MFVNKEREEKEREVFEKSVIDTFYAQQLAGISHPQSQSLSERQKVEIVGLKFRHVGTRERENEE